MGDIMDYHTDYAGTEPSRSVRLDLAQGERVIDSEDDARCLRRDLIMRGASVSLIAYDPRREKYVFDVL